MLFFTLRNPQGFSFPSAAPTICETRDANAVDTGLVKLDTFPEFENVKLLKIDVEWHEYKALSGARKIIQNINQSFCSSSMPMISSMASRKSSRS